MENRIRFRVSLSRPIQLSGADRRAVIFSIALGAYLAFITSVAFGIWYGIPVGLAVWGVGTYFAHKMGKADPYFIDVFFRAIRYRGYYPAKGRFNATARKLREW